MRPAIAAMIVAVGFGGHFAFGQASTNTLGLSEGMQALAIGSNAIPFGASVNAGDRVDLLATYFDPRTKQELTIIYAQNVVVLDVNESVTVAVTTGQAISVTSAVHAGALRIVARLRVLASPEENLLNDWRESALEHLSGRYPNIEPSRLIWLRTNWPHSAIATEGVVTVVFAEKDLVEYREDDPTRQTVRFHSQYFVRIKPDGQLVDIQQQDRLDGILKIWPAPERPVKPPEIEIVP